MGSLVTVRSVEIKPQGNTMEPPAVMAAKASSDAQYARATSIPAGSADSVSWIKIRGTSVVSADSTNASELA